ncbi:MAG: aldo/keto reductase [Elusimicrobia bacterium]|nr:aldo/keto reductase [Elusimicrobiota bacterium]
MNYRVLGKTNLKISEIGFGAWAIGGGMWGKTDDQVSLKALRRSLDLGVNFIDTAAVYGKGHSEQLIAKVYRERKAQFLVATKIPPKNWQWPAKKGTPIKEAFPADWIREQTEKSLRNLKMECVDLQQLHVWAPNWVKENDWYETFLKLKEEGKIRFIGVSLNDHTPDESLELVQSGMADTVQVIYNIFDQSPEDNLFPLCKEKNVGVIARVPLDEGSLTGKFTKDKVFEEGDWRRDYFSPEILKETVERVEKLKFLVSEEKKSLTVGALKFCLSYPAVSTVIPGIRSIQQAEENISSSDGVLLSKELLEKLKTFRWVRD